MCFKSFETQISNQQTAKSLKDHDLKEYLMVYRTFYYTSSIVCRQEISIFNPDQTKLLKELSINKEILNPTFVVVTISCS